jgi:hypothetical protein
MQEYLELMEQKSNILEHVLEMTKRQVFTGEQGVAEDEVEAFIDLYGQREKIFERAMRLDSNIKAMKISSSPSGEDEIKLATYINKHEEMAKEILALDEANVKMYETLKNHLASDLKGVTQTKNLNEGYMEHFETSGYYFDRKN